MTAILLTTLPKSGSVYLVQMLCRNLGKPQTIISNGAFLNDSIDCLSLWDCLHHGAVTQSHLPANPLNLLTFSVLAPKMVVHVRDPRQAALSWQHHMEDLVRTNPLLLLKADLNAPIPGDYFAWPRALKLDWVIAHFIPAAVAWIAGWCRAAADPSFRTEVIFTRYEDLQPDPQAFFTRLLAFYGLAGAEAWEWPAPILGQDHFRRGETDEWRRVFSPAQQQAATGMLPLSLRERFGWLA